MDDIVLSAKDICFGYEKGRHVLKNVSLDVRRGERLAVIGSNGAGKSTLFLTLNGVLTPQSGEIYLHGERITKKDLNRLRRSVGIVFQDPDTQLIASTVYAEVSFGPLNLGLDRETAKKRTESAMRYMDIERLRDRAPHCLSGGEKKRVSIADILAMDTEIIIFDEPTVGLDPQNALALEETLGRLHDEGKTILLSTHDVELAYRWADRIAVFADGETAAPASPDEVFRDAAMLARASLRRPSVMLIYETLAAKGILPHGLCPRSADALAELINKNF